MYMPVVLVQIEDKELFRPYFGKYLKPLTMGDKSKLTAGWLVQI